MSECRLIRDCQTTQFKHCVATIGNFDGLHVGHRQLITQVVQTAKQHDLVPTVITFHPMPQTLLRPNQPFLRLLNLRQKVEQLKEWGVKQIVFLRFNEALSKLLPFAFIEQYLVNTLKVRHLFVGENFRFGYQQQGNIQTLDDAAKQFNFVVKSIRLSAYENMKMSSTAIREALLKGDLQTAKILLGRDYRIQGRVKHGAKRGRLLGFPTVNLSVAKNQRVLSGVFITLVYVEGQIYWGVTNAGTRPTLDGKHYLIETHILNFERDLYGKRIEVEFLHKIRDEMRFDDIEALKQRIKQDVKQATQYFTKLNLVENEQTLSISL